MPNQPLGVMIVAGHVAFVPTHLTSHIHNFDSIIQDGVMCRTKNNKQESLDRYPNEYTGTPKSMF